MALNSRALALAAGVVNGGLWFLFVVFSLITGLGSRTVQLWGSFYPAFSYSWGGMVITTIENFVMGFVGGWILAWLYNRFQR